MGTFYAVYGEHEGMNQRRPIDPARAAEEEPRKRVPYQQFEGWIDRQIRRAIDDGKFDNLRGKGRSLAPEDPALALAGDDAPGLRLLKNNEALPAWIELNKEIALDRTACGRILAHYERERDRTRRAHLAGEYRRRARQLNEKITTYNTIVPASSLEQVILQIELDLRDADRRRWAVYDTIG